MSVSQTKTILTPKKELAIRSTFAGRYLIIEQLGRGGMGRLYIAKERKTIRLGLNYVVRKIFNFLSSGKFVFFISLKCLS